MSKVAFVLRMVGSGLLWMFYFAACKAVGIQLWAQLAGLAGMVILYGAWLYEHD